ncbi:hypothetical protein [Fodinicola feengrottensis]|uniref:Uncharacterized protein n=1 Tax=Fodinicola feengrottensis TaxID=435914 RepID=A0ABN2GA84_9ACTN|nr:hypothetical protein [Fodinicola feengrottensis]
MTYYDVHPEPVISAGTNTAATSADWQTWAHQSETALRGAASGAADATVGGAFEDYLSSWNPKLQGIAKQAEAQGVNATSAANVVVGADGQSATLLNQPLQQGSELSSTLSRPITGN